MTISITIDRVMNAKTAVNIDAGVNPIRLVVRNYVNTGTGAAPLRHKVIIKLRGGRYKCKYNRDY